MSASRRGSHPQKRRGRQLGIFRDARGAQLLEFALVLPVLLVLLVGIVDFAQAFNLKQKLNNAAREGARAASGLTCADCGLPAPPTTQAIRDVVANYLTNAGVRTCAVGATPAPAGPLAWQYSSTTTGDGCVNFTLLIERGYAFANSKGVLTVGTRVSLAYPVNLTIYRTTSTISTDAIMQNLL